MIPEWGRGRREKFLGRAKTLRSPDEESLGEKGIEETMRRLMREELRDVMREIREVKG